MDAVREKRQIRDSLNLTFIALVSALNEQMEKYIL